MTAFQEKFGDAVLDDHIALQNVGLPAIDIIDFSHPHRHKLSDIPFNCSADSLAQVAGCSPPGCNASSKIPVRLDLAATEPGAASARRVWGGPTAG